MRRAGPTQFLQSTWKAAIPGQPANPRGQPTNGGQHGGGAAATTARCGQFAGGSSTTTAEAAAPAALLRGGQATPVPTSPAVAPTEGNGGTTVDGANPLGLGGRNSRWSHYAGQQGGSQSACRSWWARWNEITAPSSHSIAANQSRRPEGRLQGLLREFGRRKIDRWVNWTVRTRKRQATQAKDMWLICALQVARHGARRKSS